MQALVLASAILALAHGQDWGNEGTLMYIAFPHNDAGSTSGLNEVMITGPVGTNVHVTSVNPVIDEQRTIGSTGLIREVLPGSSRISAPGLSDKAVRISADAPVAVHVSNAVDGTAGGYMAFPARSGDVQFMSAAYDPLGSRDSQITFIGTEADTNVEVFTPTGALHISFTLNEYSTYSLGSRSLDYTGYFISSTRPISVVSGHECGNVPVGTVYCDHMAAQIPGNDYLGTTYVVPPIAGRVNTTGYRVRVIPAFDNTNITIGNYNFEESAFSNRGEWTEYDVTPTVSTATVTCSQPCLVTYYNKGGTADGTNSDPFMGLVFQTDMYSDNVTFATARRSNNSPFNNHLSIIALNSVTGNLELTGAPLTATWEPVYGLPDYSWTTLPILDGSHNLAVVDSIPGRYFGAYVHGHSPSNEESYAYAAGVGFADGQHPPTTTTASPSPSPTGTVGPTDWPPSSIRPVLEVLVNSTYRTQDGSILSGPCVTLYSDRLSTRNIQMALVINSQLLGQSLCPGFGGASLLTADITFINRGNMGDAALGMWIPGYVDKTFTEMHECGWEISTYLQDMDNWGRPIIDQEPGCPGLIFEDRFDHFDWRWKCVQWNN